MCQAATLFSGRGCGGTGLTDSCGIAALQGLSYADVFGWYKIFWPSPRHVRLLWRSPSCQLQWFNLLPAVSFDAPDMLLGALTFLTFCRLFHAPLRSALLLEHRLAGCFSALRRYAAMCRARSCGCSGDLCRRHFGQDTWSWFLAMSALSLLGFSSGSGYKNVSSARTNFVMHEVYMC